jgi:hypothetical protein
LKNLLLRILNIHFNKITTNSVGWPTVVHPGKHTWSGSFQVDVESFSILPTLYSDFFLPLMLMSETPQNACEQNNRQKQQHWEKGYHCSKAIEDDYHGSFLHWDWSFLMYVKFTKIILKPASPNLFLPYIFYFYTMIIFIV